MILRGSEKYEKECGDRDRDLHPSRQAFYLDFFRLSLSIRTVRRPATAVESIY